MSKAFALGPLPNRKMEILYKRKVYDSGVLRFQLLKMSIFSTLRCFILIQQSILANKVGHIGNGEQENCTCEREMKRFFILFLFSFLLFLCFF